MNKSIRCRWLIFLFACLVLCIFSVVIYIFFDKSLDRLADIPHRTTNQNQISILKVGIIGDSWVSDKQLDLFILDTITKSGIHAEVVSRGHPGAKSRQIYRDFVSETETQFTSRFILMDAETDYLVVVAGVNDTAGHIGSDFYGHHIKCIVQAAQMRDIYPIIVEVPEYGIEDTPCNGFLSYIKRSVYQTLFDKMEPNAIQTYRDAFIKKLSAEMLANMSIVNFSQITTDYHSSRQLYANPSHLNATGKRELGELIGNTIVKLHLNKNKTPMGEGPLPE